jgi:hypothetical protein
MEHNHEAIIISYGTYKHDNVLSLKRSRLLIIQSIIKYYMIHQTL